MCDNLASWILIGLLINLIYMALSDLRFRRKQNEIWDKLKQFENDNIM